MIHYSYRQAKHFERGGDMSRELTELSVTLEGEERRLNAIIGRLKKGDTRYLEQGLELMLDQIHKARGLAKDCEKHYKL